MFICGNTCNGDNPEPQIAVNSISLPAKFMSAITKKSKRTKKEASVMLQKCKYDEYLEQCRLKNQKFTDKDFPPDQTSLKFKVEGRQITWRRITDVVKNCIMVQDDFKPEDIHQGNVGDCYFLSSLAALAAEEERIEQIFHNNFEISGHGIYKLIIVNAGVPSEMIIDDYIPVFASTNRPVFCKSAGRQIWVMLLEKAWAKIKGSYGEVSAGCPHEVLQAFSIAPCYYYQIEDDYDQDYKNYIWEELADGADELMPTVAGTKKDVAVPGLLPLHAYTVLDCVNVVSYGKNCRLMKLRNPWGKTEYTGKASQNDKQFWDGVEQAVKERMRPAVGVDDGIFTLPFQIFWSSFESIDILNCIFGFSYEFQKVKMYKGEPLFIRFDIKEQHEAFITVERQFKKDVSKDKEMDNTNYGFSRLIIAHVLDQDTFEYYSGQLETDFPDITRYVDFKPGRYIMYVEVEDTRLTEEFQATFSYYFDTLEVKENKHWEVQYGNKYPHFLEKVFTNHAIRLYDEKAKLGSKPEDWVKTNFMYEQGGFGYVMVNLDPTTNVKASISINRQKINESGFYLLGSYPEEEIIEAGNNRIIIFSCRIDSQKASNIVFPPPGFKVSRLA